jgi:septum formation protein
MDPLPDATIDALLAEGQVMWCAGGLMIEHPLVAPLITRIEGTPDAVMGLGKETVMRVLADAAGF